MRPTRRNRRFTTHTRRRSQRCGRVPDHGESRHTNDWSSSRCALRRGYLRAPSAIRRRRCCFASGCTIRGSCLGRARFRCRLSRHEGAEHGLTFFCRASERQLSKPRRNGAELCARNRFDDGKIIVCCCYGPFGPRRCTAPRQKRRPSHTNIERLLEQLAIVELL